MDTQTGNRVKLGAFVLTATVFLLIGLYFIGSKKNIFHSTVRISTNFSNVNGLMPGNNVRFNGINVGTVSKLYPVADTAIKVEFTVDKDLTEFISKDAIVSIGTDGMLGSKLLNISPGKGKVNAVKENDVLVAMNPIQMDNALRTLVKTNDNLEVLSDNLKIVSEKFNKNNSLWNLLTDTVLAENVRTAVVSFKLTGKNTAIVTGELGDIVKDIKAGKGTIGALLTDTVLSKKMKQTIVNIKAISDSVVIISGNFKDISANLKNGKGSMGALLTDTSFIHNLNQSLESIKHGAGGFNENMEALKYSWPFKKYYKRKK